MNDLLIVAAAFVPILLAPFSGLPLARWLPIFAPLPALAAAGLVPTDSAVGLPWLLLGVHLQLDDIGHGFLLFSALIWLFAALLLFRQGETGERPVMFRSFFLMAMGGNLLLILAADMATFYVGFALMGLSAYPLVLRNTQHARHAGRIYLTFTLIGELALFVAMVLLFADTGTLLFSDAANATVSPVAVALLLFGFGIKVALPGLHPWLPMVYSAAPIITVAVLSGPMMKAGLLGWLRFVPVGQDRLVFWGELLTVLGALGIVLGVVVGLLQRDPRAVLGYSSIAKMGLISALFGHALAVPAHANVIVLALVVFAMYHLLVKSTLFLALGEWQERGRQRWLLVVLGLLAFSLAGAPLSGGAAAKLAVKGALSGDLAWLLSISAIGTALLMARFMSLLLGKPVQPVEYRVAAWPWPVLLPLAFWGPFLPGDMVLEWSGLGPLAIAAGLAFLGGWLSIRYPALSPRVFPGDVIHPLIRWMPRRAEMIRFAALAADAKQWLRGLTMSSGAGVALVAPGVWLLVLSLVLLGALLMPF